MYRARRLDYGGIRVPLAATKAVLFILSFLHTTIIIQKVLVYASTLGIENINTSTCFQDSGLPGYFVVGGFEVFRPANQLNNSTV